MTTKDVLIAEEGNNFVESGGGDIATFDKNAEVVKFELEPKPIGLTKEQLEKYRNDPFWKPVRTVLFVLFWFAWALMFAGAIAIVVLSPKCAEKQKPDWWQTKVSYQLLTATFYDSDGDGIGDFAGISQKIDFLRKIGVTTVYPTPVIKIQKDEYFNEYDVVDHVSIDDRFGTEEQFQELIDTVHNRGMFLVMDLPISTVDISHPWFEKREESKFIVARPSEPGFNKTNFYPFHGANNIKYLGYPTSQNPVLNWRDPDVKDTINRAFIKFLDMGVDGFHVDHISQLAVDNSGEPNHDNSVTMLKEITQSIQRHIDSKEELAQKKIVLFSTLKDVEDLHVKAVETGLLHYVIDNSFANLNEKKCEPSIAKCVHDALDQAYRRHEVAKYTPHWQFSNSEVSRLASRFPSSVAHLLSFLQLTLPGAISIYYGQEYGLKDAVNKNGDFKQMGVMQWYQTGTDHHGFSTNDIFFPESDDKLEMDNYNSQFDISDSPLKIYRKLAKLRQRDEALIVGETVRDELINDDVILFSRYVQASNNTATGSVFVVALNFGEIERTVDFSIPQISKLIPPNKDISKAEVSVATANVTAYQARQHYNFAESPMVLPPKQAVLLKL
ncbi:CBN-ATGP-1 protein [Caenorhabditis brenneri]|uniref:alpha-glucosidase n=1 Tax=Caenorhabditis brenneri TaxID=135651 RepID=G0MRI3_CAEBE|nr:CBN-ATGP-1 protein [Caenorhabditis brenneri]